MGDYARWNANRKIPGSAAVSYAEREVKMRKIIKEQEWYKHIFAKFQRKDFMYLIMYVLILLGGHIFYKMIGYSKITEQQSMLFQERLVSFFVILLFMIVIHYIVRVIEYMWEKLKSLKVTSNKIKEETT